MALDIAHFPTEADHLLRDVELGLTASQAILGSETLPVLLEGMLTLGNYVNTASSSLGGAMGVSLDSLSRLAHTKSRGGPQADQAEHSRAPASPENALCLLVWQLQGMHGASFLPSLVADLQTSSLAKDIDPAVIWASALRCEAKVGAVRQKFEEFASGDRSTEPPALQPQRLEAFLAQAEPRLKSLKEKAAALGASATALQKYFAEPPESTLPVMLKSLVSLLEALPKDGRGPAATRAGAGAQRRPLRRVAKPKQLVRKALKVPGRSTTPAATPRATPRIAATPRLAAATPRRAAATPRMRTSPKPAAAVAVGPLGLLPAVPKLPSDVPKLALGTVLERCGEETDAVVMPNAPRRPVVPPLQMAKARAIAPTSCGPPMFLGTRSPTLPLNSPLASPPAKSPHKETDDSGTSKSSETTFTSAGTPQQLLGRVPQDFIPSSEPVVTPVTRVDTQEFSPASDSRGSCQRALFARESPLTIASASSHELSDSSFIKDATYRSYMNSGESTAASTLPTPTSSTARVFTRQPHPKLADILMGLGKTPRSGAIESASGSPEAP